MGKDLKGKELGSGILQKSNGMYSGRYVDRFGKRKELYDRNLAELKRRLNTAKFDDIQGHNLISDSITLSEWYKKWMDIHKYKVIRNNTVRHYNTIFYKHIEPVLGKRKLKEIRQLDVKELIKNLDEKGYQFETQNKVKVMLSDMFNKALIDDYVLKNPCKGIKVIRDEKKDVRVLSKEEQIDFFSCSQGTFYDNLYVVMVSTGLRQGEICALTCDDIDLKNKELHVTKTLLYQKLEGDSKKTFHINPPKTKTSHRTIPINKQCEQALKKQFIQRNNIMSRQCAKPLEGFENLLFTTKYGTPLCDQIIIDAIKRIVDEVNLIRDELEQFEMFSPHCLRHTFATRCFEAGVEPKTVQLFLGHASLQMTMDLYTHVFKDHKENAMSKLDILTDDIYESASDMIDEQYENMITEKNKIVPIFKRM